MHETENYSAQLLVQHIKISLFSLGISEEYNSFLFLTDIVFYMIRHNNDSQSIYTKSIELISEKYNLNKRTITNSLNQLLKNCDKKLTAKLQFNLSTNGMLNKIRVIKNAVLDDLKKLA